MGIRTLTQVISDVDSIGLFIELVDTVQEQESLIGLLRRPSGSGPNKRISGFNRRLSQPGYIQPAGERLRRNAIAT